MARNLYARLFSAGFVQGDLPVGDTGDIESAHAIAISFCRHGNLERYYLHKNLGATGAPKVFREGYSITQEEPSQ